MTQAENDGYRLASYCRRYRLRTGAWPDLPQLLAEASDLPATDPWGRPWRIDVAGDGASTVVACSGADGRPGTDDDVRSPRVGLEGAPGAAADLPAPGGPLSACR